MTRNVLTAEQTALRLGVKLATIYAYVSRGVLRRTLANDGRTSLFDSAEVEALAVRGRPRAGTPRRGSIAVSLVTGITRIDPHRLSYRGVDVATLAGTPFERVAELLWTGELPDKTHWPAPALRLREASALDRFAALAARLAPRFPLRTDLRPASVIQHGRVLLSTFAGGTPVAAHLWGALAPSAPTRAHVALLDTALVLLADHELATSTMAVRVAASCRANPFAAVLAGLGALNGPLHGGAAIACHRMLVDAATTSAEPAVARALEGDDLRGFGHPVYAGEDPRATCLLARLDRVASRRDLAVVADTQRIAARVTGTSPNVDFALAAFAFVAGMEPGATEAIFALARTAGWLAHAIEEYGEEPLRFRARAIYLGKS